MRGWSKGTNFQLQHEQIPGCHVQHGDYNEYYCTEYLEFAESKSMFLLDTQ